MKPASPRILTINGGSSSIKFAIFEGSDSPRQILLGAIERIGLPGAILRVQVERMLKSPKAAAFTENFVGQWLGLREIDVTEPSYILYQEFDHMLKVSMIRETELFFAEVLKDDLSLTNFVASDFTMLNARLAKHYGIPGVDGFALRKMTLPPGTHRGGVLTMASVLTLTSDPRRTSPVLRGKWVLEEIFGTPSPPPPPVVATLPPGTLPPVILPYDPTSTTPVALVALNSNTQSEATLFDTGRYTLKPGAREKLAKISGIVLAHPSLKLDVEGHTDSVGGDAYNQTLSEQLAKAVQDYLVAQGLNSAAVTAKGLGKTMPVADNNTAAGRQRNRRVELVVSGEAIGSPLGQVHTQVR